MAGLYGRGIGRGVWEHKSLVHEGEINLDAQDTQPLDERAGGVGSIALVVGIAGMVAAVVAASFADESLRRFAHAYLTNFVFFLSLSVGCLLFVLLTHLFRAGWAVLVRRVAEVFAATMPAIAVLSAPIIVFVLLNDGGLYPWAQPLESAHGEHAATDVELWSVGHGEDAHEQVIPAGGSGEPDPAHDPEFVHLVEAKRVWLNVPFFVVRWVSILVIWSAMGVWYWKTSLRQDETADAQLTRKMEIFSAPGTLIWAITITIASFDLLMSLSPTWFSTIFGVYYFSGTMMATFAVLILALMGLQKLGLMSRVTIEHYHDLGKLMFAFVVFWAYIAYCQYMLIWYTTLPTETPFLDVRGFSTSGTSDSAYWWVGLYLLFGHFVIPFAGLLSRHVKRYKPALAFWAIWLLVAHWIDMHWLVMPAFEHVRFTFGLVEVACFLGIGGLFLAAVVRVAAKRSLVPTGDPRLAESVAFRNI